MKVKRVCRVCGQTYEACTSINPGPGIYNWRKVACCPEHGAQYLHDVLASRGLLPEQQAQDKDASADDTGEVFAE